VAKSGRRQTRHKLNKNGQSKRAPRREQKMDRRWQKEQSKSGQALARRVKKR
jgi:hypothetical protein